MGPFHHFTCKCAPIHFCTLCGTRCWCSTYVCTSFSSLKFWRDCSIFVTTRKCSMVGQNMMLWNGQYLCCAHASYYKPTYGYVSIVCFPTFMLSFRAKAEELLERVEKLKNQVKLPNGDAYVEVQQSAELAYTQFYPWCLHLSVYCGITVVSCNPKKWYWLYFESGNFCKSTVYKTKISIK